MSKTRRRYLAAVGATLAIAGCQDGGGPAPEGTPGGAEEVAGEEGATPVPGQGEGSPGETDTPTGGDGAGTEDGADGGAEAPQDGGTEGDEGNGTGDGTTATVAVADHEEYGAILVDGQGRTLYVFEEDSQGAAESACTDECVENWPPFTTGSGDPEAGEDVRAEITTFERADGDTQVAANGWPLYTFVEDNSPGDANGQGVNEIWWVADGSGEPVRDGGTGGSAGEETGDDGAGAGDGTEAGNDTGA